MTKARMPDVDLTKLCDSIRSSRRVLQCFRDERREAVRKIAGDHWSSETSQIKRPVNFLSLYVQIVSRNLLSHDPRVNLDTSEKQYRRTVSAMEDWANPEIVRMKLADELHRVILDALVLGGIMKVGLASPGEAEASGWTKQFGQPYACLVDWDDFAFDTHARDIHKAAWYAHRSRVPLSSLADSKLYRPSKRKDVQANPDKQINDGGDERISMLGRQYVSGDQEEAYEHCDIWEVYLPREKLILTLLSEDGGLPTPKDNQAFDVRPWVGPYCGPYHFLRFMVIPGNAMPKGPILDLLDMDEDMNGVVTKLVDQAARQKSLLFAAGAADSDVQRIKDAADGDVIRVENPDKVKSMDYGSPNQPNHAFSLQMWDFLNKMSGNLELMGGLSAQSKTATQDKMLNANSSRSVVDMQQTVVQFTSDVITSLCWFWHHHPAKEMTGYRSYAGMNSPIKRVITPEDRQQIPFDDLKLQVDPYSFQHQTPQERMAFLNQVVTQIITPLAPLLQQQGVFFDVAKYLEKLGEFGNSPDLSEIVHFGAPTPADPSGGGDGPKMPVATERTYNRVNSSEATEQGQNKSIQQALLGQNPGGNNETRAA